MRHLYQIIERCVLTNPEVGSILREMELSQKLLGRLVDFDPKGKQLLAQLSDNLKTTKQLTYLGASPRRSDESFQFAVLGDAEPGRFWFSRMLFNIPGVFWRQVQEVQNHPVDFSIQLGDMVSRGALDDYLRFFQDMSALKLKRPYLTVIGNHDRYSPHLRSNSDLYRLCFGSTNYFFDHGGIRFIAVDTSAHQISLRQLKWLSLVLQTKLRKIVFTHIPPATLRHWTDFSGTRGLGGFRKRAEEFTEVLSRYTVDRVYLGHIHGFGVQDFGGVRYVLSGGGGSPLFPSDVRDRFYHYIIVTVTERGLKETVHTLDRRSFEIPEGKVLISR